MKSRKFLISLVLVALVLGGAAYYWLWPQPQPQNSSTNQEINDLVNAMAEFNVLHSEHIGYAGVTTEQWKRFEKLKDLASDEELVRLTDHQNAVVRSYAFQALVEKRHSDIYPILLNHLIDDANTNTMLGCILSFFKTGDYFYYVVSNEHPDALTNKQRVDIERALIMDSRIQLQARRDLLVNLLPKPEYYQRIRELAQKEKIPEAAVALARFKNQEDKEIIASFFDTEDAEYYAIYAAREFPDEHFYPLLVKVFEREWKDKYYDYPLWRVLYQALSKYPKPQTYKLFERTIKTKDEFRYRILGKDLLIALTKYPDKFFRPLKDKIYLDKYTLEDMKDEMYIEK